MSVTTPYKPSPLGYGSSPTRGSPFRRPDSTPTSPSPLRHTTPSTSPAKAAPLSANAPRFATPTTPTSTQESSTPKAAAKSPKTPEEMAPSFPRPSGSRTPTSRSLGSGNALSQLQPTQVRTLRDAFQILDRDCDGVVNREDVADMLGQLGLPANYSDITKFFPTSGPQTIALAAFLNSLADALAALSPSPELLSAFSAFDDDDSGQVDLSLLREALIHTVPDPGERPLTAMEVEKVVSGFTGRRAFNKTMSTHLGTKRSDVFRYQEFVSSIMGTNNGSEGGSNDGSED